MSLRDFTPPPDPMMEELYAIRDEISAQTQGLTHEQRVELLERETDEILAQNGYELRPHPTIPNCHQMVKKA